MSDNYNYILESWNINFPLEIIPLKAGGKNTYKLSTALTGSVFSVGSNAAAVKIASNLSIFSKRSILLSESIRSISCIDSVRLVGSEFRGEITPNTKHQLLCEHIFIGFLLPVCEVSLSKLGYSSLQSSSSESELSLKKKNTTFIFSK